MKLKATNNNLIIKPLEEETKIYSTVEQNVWQGEILDCFSKKYKKGQKVLFSKYGYSKFETLEGEKFLILKEEDVLAIIED